MTANEFINKYGKHAFEKEILTKSLQIEGWVKCDHFRGGKLIHTQEGSNIIPTAGLNHFLDVVMGATAKISTWYVGIFTNNITPDAGDVPGTELGAAGTYGEGQDADYDVPATNKPEYIDVPAAAGVMTNVASPAAFTIAATITVYGAFLSSGIAKTATTGTLLASKLFSSSRAVIDDDVLSVTYQITAASA